MDYCKRQRQTNTIAMLQRHGYTRVSLRHFTAPENRNFELEKRAKELELKILIKL